MGLSSWCLYNPYTSQRLSQGVLNEWLTGIPRAVWDILFLPAISNFCSAPHASGAEKTQVPWAPNLPRDCLPTILVTSQRREKEMLSHRNETQATVWKEHPNIFIEYFFLPSLWLLVNTFFFSLLTATPQGTWKFPGQGLTPSQSCDPTHTSPMTRATAVRSLPSVPRRELL